MFTFYALSLKFSVFTYFSYYCPLYFGESTCNNHQKTAEQSLLGVRCYPEGSLKCSVLSLLSYRLQDFKTFFFAF